MSRSRRGQASVTPPDLPPGLAEPDEAPELADGGHLRQIVLAQASYGQRQVEDLLIEQVVSRRSSWQQAELNLLQCSDSRFEGDDLAGLQLQKPYLRRVEFSSCRMLGVAWMDGDLEDVLLQHCTLDLARIWNCRLASARFEQCSLREASFDGTDLSGVRFAGCDLSRADLRGARLAGADLRGSTIAGVQVNAGDLKGAIIDPEQALQLVELLGVMVRPASS